MLGELNRYQHELFVAGRLDELIPDDHILKRVNDVIDLTWLRNSVADTYSAENGRPSIDPEAAVRLMLAGFFHGIVHDRRLMREAQVNIAMRWFAGYQLHDVLPDHSSLTRIRQRWGAERFREIFRKTVDLCAQAQLVNADTVHIDATLIRADVSWDSLVEQHITCLEAANNAEDTPRQRQKRVSLTDPEASLATSSRKSQAIPAYKQHAAVDDRSGVVVEVITSTGDTNEADAVEALVEGTVTNTGQSISTLTADAGYAYGKVFQALEEHRIDAIIPVKKEPKPKGRYPIRRFKYDPVNQRVRCPQGRYLKRSTRTRHGWYYRSSVRDCRDCPRRQECLSPRVERRTIVISDAYPALLRARRRRHRWGAYETRHYSRHRWRAEGANAEAKRFHGLYRAVRRGIENVAIQVYLTAAVMNLKRLATA